MFQGFRRVVAQAVAGGLGAGQGAAEGQPLAGDDAALKAVNDALILAVQVGHLPGAHADVAGGGIGELADVAVQLRHKALAEAHDLPVALALGVKVRAALAAAHGQGGQGVFQDLLETQELDDGQVHAGVEAQAALVGADGGVVLHAVAPVDPGLAAVVHPGDAELNHTFRLHKALQQADGFPFGVLVHNQLQRFKNLLHCLQKLRLVGVSALHLGVDTV